MSDAIPLWEGDKGTMDAPTRSVLVELIRKPYLDRETKPDAFAVLKDPRLRAAIESRLNDMFMELVFAENDGIAYKRNVEGDDSWPRVMVDNPMSACQTLVILILRQMLIENKLEDEVLVDVDDLVQRLSLCSSFIANDEVGLRKKVVQTCENLSKPDKRILLETNVEGTYRIHRVLGYLFKAEEAEAVIAAYQEIQTIGE